jgi:hypothetical protein
MLELHAGKLARAVLRGGGAGDSTSLPDPEGADEPAPEVRAAYHALIAEWEARGRAPAPPPAPGPSGAGLSVNELLAAF